MNIDKALEVLEGHSKGYRSRCSDHNNRKARFYEAVAEMVRETEKTLDDRYSPFRIAMLSKAHENLVRAVEGLE